MRSWTGSWSLLVTVLQQVLLFVPCIRVHCAFCQVPFRGCRKYDAMMDSYLEDSYQSYLKRHGEREKAAAEKRKRLGMATDLTDSEAEEDGAAVVNRSLDPAAVEAVRASTQSSHFPEKAVVLCQLPSKWVVKTRALQI